MFAGISGSALSTFVYMLLTAHMIGVEISRIARGVSTFEDRRLVVRQSVISSSVLAIVFLSGHLMIILGKSVDTFASSHWLFSRAGSLLAAFEIGIIGVLAVVSATSTIHASYSKKNTRSRHITDLEEIESLRAI